MQFAGQGDRLISPDPKPPTGRGQTPLGDLNLGLGFSSEANQDAALRLFEAGNSSPQENDVEVALEPRKVQERLKRIPGQERVAGLKNSPVWPPGLSRPFTGQGSPACDGNTRYFSYNWA